MTENDSYDIFFTMKKLVILFIIFSLFIILNSQNGCPYDMVNDPYPGQCGRYTDKNDDSICDFSQNLNDTLIEKEVPVDFQDESVKDTLDYDSSGVIESESTLNYLEEKEDEQEKVLDNENGQQNIDQETEKLSQSVDKIPVKRKNDIDLENKSDRYFLFILLPIFFFFLSLIIFSLSGKIKIDICLINKYLNIFLMFIFLPLFISSILLILIEYDLISFKNIKSLIYVHNFTGIVFIMATILHVVIKFRCYNNLLKEILRRREKK